MKKIIVLLLLSFLTFSCKSSKATHEKEVTTVNNKELVVTYKDTIIYVPKVHTTLSVPLSEFTNVNISDKWLQPRIFTNNNGRSKATIEIKPNEVIVTAECDSLALRAQIKKELIKQYSTNNSTEINDKKTSKGVSIFSVILYCISFLVLGAVAGYLIRLFNII